MPLLDWLPGGPRALAPLLFVLGLAGWIAFSAHWPRSRRRRLRALREAWGRPEPRRRRDAAVIAALHQQLREAPPAGAPEAIELGEETAEDLDLGELSAALDHTLSEVGQQALHRLLRRPLLDLAELRERGRRVRLLRDDAAVREALQLRLLPLAEAAPGTLVPLLSPGQALALPLPAWAYRALTAASLAALAAWAAAGAPGLLAVGAAYVACLVAHYAAERVVSSALPGVTALQRLLGAARALAEEGPLPGLEAAQEALRGRLRELEPLRRALAGIGPPPATDDLALYVDILLLRQVRLLSRAAPLITLHRAGALALAEEVGTLDALQAAASFLSTRQDWCAPCLDPAAPGIEADGLRHPLLTQAQENPLALRGGALITGSNMAGKSTWLRTVGVNALLAQTLHACRAARWEGPPLRLATSLRRSDSLLAGRSYYLAEAQGILAALRATNRPPRPLCLLDEIFRGTNTAERIAASTEVLRWLVEHGALVLAATHDDALARLLAGRYENLHFSEKVGTGGLEFDYRLREGPATTRNAIALLRHLGYPVEITAAARERSEP